MIINELDDHIKNSILNMTKEILKKILSHYNIFYEENGLKSGLTSKVFKLVNDKEILNYIIEKYPENFGINGNRLREILNCDEKERKRWTKKGLLEVAGHYKVRAYGRYLYCPLYSLKQLVELEPEIINSWRDNYKEPSEKQLASLAKAREKQLKDRTCIRCGRKERSKEYLNSNKLCDWCYWKEVAINERKKWLNNKEKYVILDVESTGLYDDAEIVEIGILDLDGNIVLDTLIKPMNPIPSDVIEIHGINNDMVAAAPTWDKIFYKVQEILNDKTFIAFNSEFDARMLEQTNLLYGIKLEFNHSCLMNNVMNEYNTDRYISLKDAAGEVYQSHRAIDDCRICLKIIKDI